ncbi:N-acetylmuramoyl-L-alanine amidase [Deinococcus peraridilitoris DSM 19664]|uniref:N-acetylmuramoyl-L-alanine amidase n=2 Tax=Deinococcus TaxID=1298 RepID=L0A3N0_DEIPD|nr:N-acetylmuramoyl-L-alanine amidase [Deinococcus peraridilitoris DSM 19664]
MLPTPRISSAGGTTRVVLDLPEDARYSLTPTFGGLRIDFANVSARAQGTTNISGEVSSWQYTATASGAIATIFTHYPLGLSGGWRSFELPADGVTARRLVIDFAATLQGGAQDAPEGTVRTVPPSSASQVATTSVPTLPLPETTAPVGGLIPLAAPRIGKSPGSTRVVLELPASSRYSITTGPLGLRVELTGVTAAAQAAQQVSPELAEWRFEPTASGIGVVLRTTFTMNGRGGFKTLLLPPVEGGTLNRLAIDIAPAIADTSPLPLTEAALPRFTLPVRIVLDPGHGGTDPGAIGTVIEKQVALDVALRVRALLQAAGAQVTMTRDRDSQLSSNKSSDLAMRGGMGQAPNNVLVSIHVNAMDKNAVMRGYGVETWWYPNAAGSGGLAASLQAQVIRFSGAYSQGLKSTSLAVLRNSKIPSALVEIGYTSHPVDGQNLLSSNYLDRVAAGIAWGIRDYLMPGNASLPDN